MALDLSPGQTRALQLTIPRTDDDLWYWVRAILGVTIPRERVCPHHSAPFEAFADAYFARHPVAVWKASRGFGGKSFLLSLLAVTEQIILGAMVNILGGSLEQSKRVLGYINGTDENAAGKLWDAPLAPRWMMDSNKVTEITTNREDGNGRGVMKALAASQKSVRGPHPQRLRLDEVDEMDLRIFDAAMGQTMPSRGIETQTVASSTHQNPDGTFSEILKRAAERDWPVFEWCYRESMAPRTGWLAKSAVERKRLEVPSAMWQTEYEGQEPNPEGRAIDPDALENLFDRRLGEWEGAEGETIEIISPDVGGLFYHGTDWAKSTDWTILHTMHEVQGGPDRLAAWARFGRRPWPVMIGKHNERVRRYGPPYLSTHDATGVGEVCDDYLEVPSQGFDFRHRKARSEMLSNYIAAIESGEFVYPAIAHLYREHKFATVDDLYGSGHLPDSISAAAMSHKAKTEGLRDRPSLRTLGE